MCSRTVYWHGVTYVVALSIDLNGETLSVRENCVLKFNSRGSFNDEVVKGEKMIVEGLSKKKFFNVLFTSSFDLSLFSYVTSGKYTNDTTLLQAMFDLFF